MWDRDISKKELVRILENHGEWVDSLGQRGEKADLSQANPHGANLHGANLQGADLLGAQLMWTDLKGANLRWAHLEWASLLRANLQGANLQGAKLQRANLREADLQGAKLQEADLQGADHQGANLLGADFQGANLQGANLQGAKLQRANLQEADLQGANLQGFNLQVANLQDANLQGADLQGAKLQGANLQGANLQEANFQGANLQGADLQGANLKNANLIGARIEGCRSKNTILTRAIFLVKQMETINNTWIGEPIGKHLVLFGIDEHGDNIPAYRFLMLFPGSEALGKVLTDLEKAPADYQACDIRMINLGNQTLYLARFIGENPLKIFQLGENLVNELKQSITFMHNLSELLIENLVATQINTERLNQLKILEPSIHDLLDKLSNFDQNQIGNLEKALQSIGSSQNEVKLSQEQVIEISKLFYQQLNKHEDAPGFIDRLMEFVGKISEGVVEHAVAMPIVYGAKEVLGVNGLALVGGAGLVAGLSMTAIKWLNERRHKSIESKNNKLIGQ